MKASRIHEIYEQKLSEAMKKQKTRKRKDRTGESE